VQREARDQKTLHCWRRPARERHGAVEPSTVTLGRAERHLTFLNQTRQLIWASNRSGFSTPVLYDWNGHLIRPLTKGDWLVTGDNDNTDPRSRRGSRSRLFHSKCRVALELTVQRFVCRPSSRCRRYDGLRLARPSPCPRYDTFLDTFSTPDQPPSLTLRSRPESRWQSSFPTRSSPSTPTSLSLGTASDEFGTLSAKTGQTLHYQIIKPAISRTWRRYPVIVDVYGGRATNVVFGKPGRLSTRHEGFFRQFLRTERLHRVQIGQPWQWIARCSDLESACITILERSKLEGTR